MLFLKVFRLDISMCFDKLLLMLSWQKVEEQIFLMAFCFIRNTWGLHGINTKYEILNMKFDSNS